MAELLALLKAIGAPAQFVILCVGVLFLWRISKASIQQTVQMEYMNRKLSDQKGRIDMIDITVVRHDRELGEHKQIIQRLDKVIEMHLSEEKMRKD